MATLTEIRDGLVDRLATIDGLTVATADTANLPLPCAVVLPPEEAKYWGTMSDAGFFGDMDWRIHVYVAPDILADAANVLLRYIDPSTTDSVAAAVAADSTLGGLLTNATGEGACVMAWQFIAYEDMNGQGRWGVEFTTRVSARKG